MEEKTKYSKLNNMEKDYIQSIYEEEHIQDDIETFYEDNFVICENCGEIIYCDDISDNDLLTWGGEMKICQYCINDGWGR